MAVASTRCLGYRTWIAVHPEDVRICGLRALQKVRTHIRERKVICLCFAGRHYAWCRCSQTWSISIHNGFFCGQTAHSNSSNQLDRRAQRSDDILPYICSTLVLRLVARQVCRPHLCAHVFCIES